MSGEPGAGLATQDLGFRYRRTGEELFGGPTYAFAQGAVTAVTGPSGCGKSTLLHILGLLLAPVTGEVTLRGRAVSGLGDRQRSRLRASTLGFVFQDAELDPTRSVLDAVIEPGLYAGLSPQSLRPRAESLLDELGVAHRGRHRPGEISGGQAARVALCRALVGRPEVILADEPTGNLDDDNTDLVLRTLSRAAADGATVVVATHDPVVVGRADLVVRL